MKRIIEKLTIEEAEKADFAYWKSKTPEEKLDWLQQLRELHYELNNEDRKGFQRLHRIVKQA